MLSKNEEAYTSYKLWSNVFFGDSHNGSMCAVSWLAYRVERIWHKYMCYGYSISVLRRIYCAENS